MKLLVQFCIIISLLIGLPAFAQTADERLLYDAKQYIKTKQFSKAREILLTLANKGNVNAQYNLGVLYRNGHGFKKNYKKAYYWFNKSAAQKHAKSLFAAGMMKYRGQGTNKDVNSAVKLVSSAADLGYLPAKKQLLVIEKQSNKKLSDTDYQLFRKAVRTGNISLVKRYLKQGININKRDNKGYNFLMLAAESGQKDILNLFYQQNPDFKARNQFSETLLIVAIKNSQEDIALGLLQHKQVKSFVNMEDELGNNAFLLAIKYNLPSLLLPLVKAGANFNVVDNKNRSAYDYAKDKNQKQVLKTLHKLGVSEQRSKKIAPFVVQKEIKSPYANWSALMIASWRGDVMAASDLVNTTADINRQDEQGHTALSRAAWKGFGRIVKLLVAHKADVNLQQDDGSTALHWASQRGHDEIVLQLLKAGAEIDVQRNNGRTPLMLAAQNAKYGVLEILLNHGANVNTADREGTTPLMLAATANDEKLTMLLLNHKASVGMQDKKNHTALWYAVNSNNERIVNLLANKATNLEQPDAHGNFLLVQAVSTGNVEMVKDLIRAGAYIGVQTLYGNTPMMVAANNGDVEIVKLFIAKGANINRKNHVGDTALIIAIRKGHVAVVKTLLEKGADISLKNKNRHTAMDVAKALSQSEILDLLNSHKRKSGFWPF